MAEVFGGVRLEQAWVAHDDGANAQACYSLPEAGNLAAEAHVLARFAPLLVTDCLALPDIRGRVGSVHKRREMSTVS